MKLAFVPGELLLETMEGEHVVTLKGEEVFRSRNEKKALTRFNALRAQLETEHPPTQADPTEAADLLLKHIGEALVDDNHYRPQREKTQGELRRSSKFR